MNLRESLETRLSVALESECGEHLPAMVAQAKHPEHGDYQANGALAAGKRTGRNPRQLAHALLESCALDDLAYSAEVAGPGFINLRIQDSLLVHALREPLRQEVASPKTVVIDYSSPNLAKEMHVGHLRSTIIGDAMARLLEFLGHRVIRQNHVGDWGTQFGMLLAQLDSEDAKGDSLEDLEVFYARASKRYKEDEDFARAARAKVVGLQSGEAKAQAAWRRFIEVSLSHCQAIYERLGVTLTLADLAPESGYETMLRGVMARLEEKELIEQSDGAHCVFSETLKTREGSPLPLIVEKSDGGYLYATTDLAAVHHRCVTLAADRVLYFVDARQSLHFELLFEVSRRAGLTRDASLEHHAFGLMLDISGKPFKTREGTSVKLAELLDEAESRAEALVREKNPGMSSQDQREIARVVAVAAVKYADLSKHRTSDYVFDWNRILSFEGNTAPYLLYAFTRTKRILEKAGDAALGQPDASDYEGRLDERERQLALHLAQFTETLEGVAASAEPHRLCNYLWRLAAKFMRFYETSPVLGSEGATRVMRLALCERTANTLKQGLQLLGIETLERM